MSSRDLLVSTANETGATFDFTLSRQQRAFQASITGTQTVTLQGRIDSAHDFVDVLSVSVTTATLVSMLPQLRVVTTGTSGGSSVSTLAW